MSLRISPREAPSANTAIRCPSAPAGTVAGPTAPGIGGNSTLTWGGGTMTAYGGLIDSPNSTSVLSFGNIAAVGGGFNSDEMFVGSDGQTGYLSQGGMGGGSPKGGGAINSGTFGRAGYFPGGGASGAGCPSGVHYDSAAGSCGACTIRW
jgi:hypothetical protein